MKLTVTANELSGLVNDVVGQIRNVPGPEARAAERTGDEFKDALTALLKTSPQAHAIEGVPRPLVAVPPEATTS